MSDTPDDPGKPKANRWDKIAEQNALDEAPAAWNRVKRSNTWSDWMIIAMALAIIRAQAKLKANNHKGRRYNDALSELLRKHGLSDLPKEDRSALLRIWDNREQIEEWRATLDDAERATVNHPRVVWRRYEASVRATRASETPKKNPEDKPTLKQQVARKQEQYLNVVCTARARFKVLKLYIHGLWQRFEEKGIEPPPLPAGVFDDIGGNEESEE